MATTTPQPQTTPPMGLGLPQDSSFSPQPLSKPSTPPPPSPSASPSPSRNARIEIWLDEILRAAPHTPPSSQPPSTAPTTPSPSFPPSPPASRDGGDNRNNVRHNPFRMRLKRLTRRLGRGMRSGGNGKEEGGGMSGCDVDRTEMYSSFREAYPDEGDEADVDGSSSGSDEDPISAMRRKRFARLERGMRFMEEQRRLREKREGMGREFGVRENVA